MEMRYLEMFGHEFVLGADVVVEGDEGEGVRVGGIGGGGGLAIAEESGDDDEELGVCSAIVVGAAWDAKCVPSWDRAFCLRLLARHCLISLFIRQILARITPQKERRVLELSHS